MKNCGMRKGRDEKKTKINGADRATISYSMPGEKVWKLAEFVGSRESHLCCYGDVSARYVYIVLLQ